MSHIGSFVFSNNINLVPVPVFVDHGISNVQDPDLLTWDQISKLPVDSILYKAFVELTLNQYRNQNQNYPTNTYFIAKL